MFNVDRLPTRSRVLKRFISKLNNIAGIPATYA